MATYAELGGIGNEAGWDDFVKKVQVAVQVKAAAVIDSASPNAGLLEWAKGAISNVGGSASGVRTYVVASNNTLTLTQILTASDSNIQQKVDEAVEALYTTV